MNSDLNGSDLSEIKHVLNNLTTLIKNNGITINNLQNKSKKDEITVTEETNDNDKETANIINNILKLGN